MNRVIFKEEDTLDDGEPVGPVTVLSEAEAAMVDDAHPLLGRPFQPKCFCESGEREGEPGEECGRCGNQIGQPWKTLTQAKQIAAREGVELEVN
jgi:hypothetical protein